MSKPPGYFLIRVSESRIGYTLSYRAGDRCRHFMIDALEDGHYIILGENRRHRFLQDLVDFHRRTPILPFTEVLTVACGQISKDNTDYAELLFPQRHLNPNPGLPPNNFSNPSASYPLSPVDVPPALPSRPNNLRNTAALPPISQPNRLYPCLNEEFPNITLPLPVTPVAITRTRFITSPPTPHNPPSNQPPDVPARTLVPPLKQNQNQNQNQACVRTVSAPESPSMPAATEHPLGVNVQSGKNQEVKPSVVNNLKNLKKKFQKKTSTSQEFMYAEINLEAADSSGSVENEYQEITGEQTISAQPFSYTCTDMRLADGQLPQEYLPPPPFAPGY